MTRHINATQVVKGLHAAYGSSVLSLTGNGVKFVLTHNGFKQSHRL